MSKTMTLSVVVGAMLGKSYFSTLDTAQQRAQKMGAAFRETNQKLAAARELSTYRAKLDELKAKQSALGHSSARLDAGVAAVEERYRRAKASAAQYGITVGNVVAEQRRLASQSASLNRQMQAQQGMEQAGAKLNELKGKLLAGAGAAYGMARMVGSAMSEEESLVRLGTVINAPDREKAVGATLAQARSFARNSLASSGEMLEINYALNSAGLSAEVSSAGAELVHKLAKVTQGAPALVGEIFATTFNNLGAQMEGSTEERMARIGNVLAKVQFKYQIRDFGQLGESMKYAASTMASLKIDFEQGAAAIGLLNSAGLQGSMAGTAFSAVMRNMGKASEEMGFELMRSADGSLDLMATLDGLAGALDGLDTDARAARLQELFGEEGSRGIVPLLDQLQQMRQGVADVRSAAKGGLLDAEYARFVGSASGQFAMLKQNLVQVGTVLGGTLLPAVNLVLSPIAKVLGFVGAAIEKFPVLGWVIGGLAAGFLAVGAAQAVWTGAVWLFNAAMAANPLTWIVGGVIAVGLAIAAVVKHWDTIKQKTGEAMGAMMRFFKPMLAVINPIGALIDKFFGKKATATAALAASVAVAPAEPLPPQVSSLPPQASQLYSLDLPPPATAARSVNQSNTVNAPITIQTQPGQSAEDIAAAVARELEAHQRAAAARQRGALYDG